MNSKIFAYFENGITVILTEEQLVNYDFEANKTPLDAFKEFESLDAAYLYIVNKIKQ